MSFGIDSVLVLVSGCGLLCTHLWDPVPRFRRHPFSDYELASVCVCVCVTLARSSRAYLLVIVFPWLAVHFPVLRRVGSACAGSAPRPPLCGWLPCAPV